MSEIPKNQCWWAGDEARGNFLKEPGIVTSEIESKWDEGKETLTFKVLVKYWERTFTEKPDVMLRALYLYILYLYIICRAPFLGLLHKQVASEKERETETEIKAKRKIKTECQTINKVYLIYSWGLRWERIWPYIKLIHTFQAITVFISVNPDSPEYHSFLLFHPLCW